MNKFLRASALICCLITTLVSKNWGQVILTTSPYTQDFNSISSGLPTGWTVRTGSTGSALGATATLVTTATSWSTSAGNFRNGAAASGLTSASIAADQNNSTNRALAVRQTGAFGDPGAAFVLQLANTSGLTNFQLSFKLQSLDGSADGRTSTWRVDYGFGATPSSFTSVTTSPASLTTVLAAGGASWGSTDVSVNFGTALDNTANDVWIRVTTITPSTGSGSRPTTAIDDVQLSFTAGDLMPPSFSSTYPKISTLSSSSFDLVTSLSEPGKTFFVVLPNNASAPSSTQVKNGQDGAGTPLGAGLFGTINITNATTDYSASVIGLASATDYDVYVVAEDLIPNLQATPVKLDVLTNTAGDITPPTFTATYPNVNTVSATSFTVRTNLDEAGKTYFVVLPAGATAPSSVRVKAGQNGNGVAVALNLAGTINVMSAATEFTSAVSGLSPSTGYDVYIVAEDNVPNLQIIPTKISVVTSAQYLEDFNACDGTASFSQFSTTGAQVWGCTDFGRNATKGIRMNGFSGTAQLNEDWLISPVTSLGANSTLSFYSQFSFAGPSLQLKISNNFSGTGDPSSATWTDLNGNFPTAAVPSTSTSLADWTLSTVDLSAYSSQNVYVAFVYTSSTGTNTAARWTLDDISFSNAAASYLEASPSSLSFNAGGTVKSYSLRGFNLSNSITVTAPSNFTVSKDNTNFSGSILYTPAEIASTQNVFVKFDAPVGSNTFTGTISNTSTGVSTKNISVRGTDKSQTLDVTTYNLEFFGTDVKDTGGTEFGPIDDALQVSNVTTVLQNIGADIFAVQEVADDAAFNQLVSNISGFSGMLANRWSYSFDPPDANFPPQKIGFIYNSSTVQLVSSRVMFSQLYDAVRAGNTGLLSGYPTTASSFWSSGRLPFMATFDVTIGGLTKRVRVVNIHAKSGSATGDYNRRKYDVKVLHDSLVANYANDNIILLGDYNDDVDVSIGAPTNSESTYKVFVDNTSNFNSLTLAISQAGAFSFPSSSSFLDHLITSNELTNSYVSNSIVLEDPRAYISNYVNTTSDHLPVSARFLVTKENQTITFPVIADKNLGDASFTFALPTATSGLAVTVTPNSKITISGNQITLVSAGKASIIASQAGNGNYNAAPSVTREFCIKPAKPSVTVAFASGAATLTSNAANGNQWYFNGAAITGATNNSYTATNAGTYKVQVTIDNCLSDFSNDTPVVITGDLTKGNASISLYPNPTAGILFIAGLEPETNECSIVDLLGRPIMMNLEKSGDLHRLTTESLADGVYMLNVKQSSSVLQLKFVKKN